MGKLLKEKGHKVLYFSVADKKVKLSHLKKYFVKPFDIQNKTLIKKLFYAKRFIYSYEAKQRLEKLAKETKPDLAHLHIFYGRLTSSILSVLKKHNIPSVMTVHEYRMLCPAYLMLTPDGKICEKCARGNYLHCLVNRCKENRFFDSVGIAFECFCRDMFFPYHKFINRFIMVSRFIFEKHVKYKPQLKGKAVQIYNFLNIKKNTPVMFHENYYLYFGRLSSEKGVLTLLKTWKMIPEIKLKIAGTGEIEDKVKDFIKSNSMKNVEFIGFKKGKELEALIKHAKFTVLPSEWYENNPLSILESFACGTPILAANIGGIPELVEDGKNGFLFESKDEKSLLASVQKAESLSFQDYRLMSEFAYEFVRDNFNQEVFYKHLLSLYNELLASSI